MVKIDRETCPVGARLLVPTGMGQEYIQSTVLEWSPGGKVFTEFQHSGQTHRLWYDPEYLASLVVEILPADPAVPTLPGPWLEAWPSEIPDGSVWEYRSRAWREVRRFVGMGHELGHPSMDEWLTAVSFEPENGDRIRRVG